MGFFRELGMWLVCVPIALAIVYGASVWAGEKVEDKRAPIPSLEDRVTALEQRIIALEKKLKTRERSVLKVDQTGWITGIRKDKSFVYWQWTNGTKKWEVKEARKSYDQRKVFIDKPKPVIRRAPVVETYLAPLYSTQCGPYGCP